MLFELPAFHALHSIVTETVSDNCLVTMTAFTSNLWNVGVSSGVSEKMLISFDWFGCLYGVSIHDVDRLQCCLYAFYTLDCLLFHVYSVIGWESFVSFNHVVHFVQWGKTFRPWVGLFQLLRIQHKSHSSRINRVGKCTFDRTYWGWIKLIDAVFVNQLIMWLALEKLSHATSIWAWWLASALSLHVSPLPLLLR